MEDQECKKKITLMMVGFIITIAIIAGFAMISPAMALNLSLADSTLPGNHSVLIMAGDGSLLATGYSTQTFDLGAADNDSVFLIHIKADNKNILESPDVLLDEIVAQIQHSIVPIIIIGLVLFAWRR